jgi:DNA-binding transcriptional LysR family regulator
MHDLERMFGVQLLERQPTGVVPTAAGQTFAVDAQRILDRVSGVAADAHRATRSATGHCIVATIPPVLTAHLIGPLVRAVATRLPDAHVRFVEIHTSNQPDALVTGEIDLGLCHAFTSVSPFLPQLQHHRLIDDPICCALVAPDHPIAAGGEITLAERGAVPFLFIRRSVYPAFYDRAMLHFATQDFDPRIEQEYEGLQMMWSVARRGDGWCLGFRSNQQSPPAGLKAVRVRGLHLAWSLEMLARRGESSAVVTNVMDLIRRVAARSTHALGETSENLQPSDIGLRPKWRPAP